MSIRVEIASWPDEVLLTRREAAAYLAVRLQLLEEWAVAGRGPTFTKHGHFVRYPLGDLRSWIARGRKA